MKYDPIMCMMIDDSVKTEDGVGDIINYKGYKLEMVTPKDVVIYKNGKRIDLEFKYPKSFKEAKERIDKGEFDSNTIDHAIRNCDSRVSTRNVVTSNIAFEEIKKMTGIIPEKVQQKGDTMEFYHSGVKVAEWDMNNAEVKVFV